MTWEELWALALVKARLVLIAVVANIGGAVLWSVMIAVDVLPEWFAYLGGPIVGLSVAWWLYPRLRPPS